MLESWGWLPALVAVLLVVGENLFKIERCKFCNRAVLLLWHAAHVRWRCRCTRQPKKGTKPAVWWKHLS